MDVNNEGFFEITGRIEDVATFLVPIADLPKEPEQEPDVYIPANALRQLKGASRY